VRIVLDTNILLSSISRTSENRWIFDKIFSEEIHLIVSNEIITEYEEIISYKTTKSIADNVIRAILNLPGTDLIQVYYHWNLINQDPDDNKFVDCAIAGNAEYIVTNDKHFNILKAIAFPKVEVRTIKEIERIV
jgi:putative PIN family toxin of toxin-antitoxin system